jgi:hypothetical protein
MVDSITTCIGTSSSLFHVHSELQDVCAHHNGCLCCVGAKKFHVIITMHLHYIVVDKLPPCSTAFSVTFQHNEEASDVERNMFASGRLPNTCGDSGIVNENKLVGGRITICCCILF